MSYNLSNAAWVSQQTGYSIENIVALAEVAKCLNIQFKIEGMPFGAEYSRPEGYGKYEVGDTWPVGKGG